MTTSAKAQIILGEMQEVEILEAVWNAELARGRRDDGLFRYNGRLVLASTWLDGSARPVRITPVKLRYHLGQVADWYKLTPRGDSVVATPPSAVIAMMITYPHADLPML